VKRFYTDVSVADDYSLLLDGKPIKTPAKAALIAPTRALADAIAQEWREQGADIKPATMHLTKLANTAIDRVEPRRDAFLRELAEYARSDLLCYRASEPAALAARQDTGWDPLLDWAKARFRASLRVTRGVRPISQDDESIGAFTGHLISYDRWRLAALQSATALTGSLILALALAEERLDAAEAFSLSRIDEAFQAENWGRDAEAEEREQRLAQELAAAARFLALAWS
jgi:chaperone required for assembly of F1-ATPase